MENQVDDRIRTLVHFLIVFILISVIAVLCVKLFIEDQADRTLKTAMQTMSSNMSQRVLIIHNFWALNGKTSVLHLPYWVHLNNENSNDPLTFDPKKNSFVMSQSGWPKDVNGVDHPTPCGRLWVGVLAHNLELYIEKVKIMHNDVQNLCIYRTSVNGFSYNYDNGEMISFMPQY